ncbi:MAG: hypothetical protein ACLTYW_05335 [Collinsella sp.]
MLLRLPWGCHLLKRTFITNSSAFGEFCFELSHVACDDSVGTVRAMFISQTFGGRSAPKVIQSIASAAWGMHRENAPINAYKTRF